ncbi:MAG: hypothetical protein Q4D98_11535 [Planctomycetia bacterium]|nr:hypothetical protein [Planctomycetia bacterium]
MKKYLNIDKLRKLDWFYCENIPSKYFRQGNRLNDVAEDFIEDLPLKRQKIVYQAIECCELLCWDFTPQIKEEVTPIIQEIVEKKMIVLLHASILQEVFESGIPYGKRDVLMSADLAH